MFQLLDFNENPNVGVCCRANDNICFIQKGLTKKVKVKIVEALNVDLVELNVVDATIIGSLIALNNNGAIITSYADKITVTTLEKQGLKVIKIKDKINAAGNDVLINDHGCMVHPNIKDKTIKEIEKTFDINVVKGTIGSLNIVGMAAVVTSKGCLCHPKSSEEEKHILNKVFNVEVMIGTVNHGVPLIGSGLVANKNGAIIGNLTTGIEMGRIEEALGFLD